MSGRKRQQRDIPRLLDRRGKAALVRRANAGQPSWHDLAALRYELREQAHVLVIDGVDLLDAEFAHLFAAEVFASAFTSAATRRPRSARTAMAASRGAVTCRAIAAIGRRRCWALS